MGRPAAERGIKLLAPLRPVILWPFVVGCRTGRHALGVCGREVCADAERPPAARGSIASRRGGLARGWLP
jgi:hypothetical protein